VADPDLPSLIVKPYHDMVLELSLSKVPYMPLQNIANPVYVIDGSMTCGIHLSLIVAYLGLCKFAMTPKNYSY
jgi:hypothetical protein